MTDAASRSAPGRQLRPPLPSAEEIARLSGDLLHDLNDALAVVSVQIDLVALEARDGSAAPATIERLRGSFEQLRQMVRDVFDEVVGREPAPEDDFEPCEVARTAFDDWLPTAPSVGASFRFEAPSTTRVPGRASIFSRAVSNLLRNAARHARSEIRVQGRTEGSASDAVLVVTVDDDGPGVAEEMRDRIFDPFVHGGHGGTGLGLSVVRWAAQRLGGEVEASGGSPLGGARFVLRLPLVPRRDAYGEPAPGVPAPATLSGRVVAIVDEDAGLAGAYAPLLRREGATALHFSTSTAAAGALASLIGAVRPDAILLDLRLAAGRGREILRSLQTARPDLARRVLVFRDGAAADDPQPAGGALLAAPCAWEEVRHALDVVLTA